MNIKKKNIGVFFFNSTFQHENSHHVLQYFVIEKARDNLIFYTKQQK